MYRVLVSVLMLVYTLGFILLPAGTTINLTEAYHHCQAEDPDLDVADFVFEHLLNLPEIGHENDNEENEKPHQPFQHIISASQVVLSITSPVKIHCSPAAFPASITRSYPLFNDTRLPSPYSAEVFHPPIV